MTVYFVGAGPGDPDLLTLRAARLLEACDVCVYAGSLVSPEVMSRVSPTAVRHDSAALSHEEVISVLQQAQADGCRTVRLHTGDPSLYGAIAEQMRALDELGIDYEVVPGVSAFQAAAASLKLELTLPEIAQTVVLTRVAGRTAMPPTEALERIAALQATLCLYLSVHLLDDLVQKLVPDYGADCPAAVVFRASWPDERIIEGTLANIAEQVKAAGIRRTALVLVGRALGRQGPASKLYDATFAHGYRDRREE